LTGINLEGRVCGRLLNLAWAVWLLALGGCTSSGPPVPVFPVKGQLFVNNKPAHGAVVWFCPTDAGAVNVANPATNPRPSGVVQEDGTFEVSTYGTKDGAPAGRYRVAVNWTKTAGGDVEERLLPMDFMDPVKAGLAVVEVKSQPNVLPPFKITRAAR
jgi:hypothetical protein